MGRKISENITTDYFQTDSIELDQEDTVVSPESEYYHDIYRELAELIGVQNTKKIWERFHGLSVQFPQRLHSRTYSREYVRDHMGSMNIKDMAVHLSLTDRRVRQIIQELRRDNQ